MTYYNTLYFLVKRTSTVINHRHPHTQTWFSTTAIHKTQYSVSHRPHVLTSIEGNIPILSNYNHHTSKTGPKTGSRDFFQVREVFLT